MMINFTKTKEYYGVKIPADATKAVFGRNFGTYFMLNGEWYFTVFANSALKASATGDFDIMAHIRDGVEPDDV